MKKHDDSFYIEGIRDHLVALRSYLPDTKAAFLADEKTQDAVLMRLLALGEEVAHLSDGFQKQHAELDWYKIIGLRNRIAHGYFEVDPEIIWDTVAGGSLEELDGLTQAQ
jgi:uncharacterized protein with HEPN domain